MWRVSFLVLVSAISVLSAPELKQVHVVFSHKLYGPAEKPENARGIPPNLDMRYFLESAGDMADQQKRDMWNLGVYLRKRYNAFLGESYDPHFTEVRTTEYAISKTSGMLVTAGLGPTAEDQKWNPDLDLEPYSIGYVPAKYETLLLGYLCPSFIQDQKDALNTIQLEYSTQAVFDYMSKNYRKKITTPWEVALVLASVDTFYMDANGTVPYWVWNINRHPDSETLSRIAYETLWRTRQQRRLNGGYLLKKILLDSADHHNSEITTKLSLYSGEIMNIMGLLEIVGAWEFHTLGQGASIIFEYYKDSVTHEDTIKMFYLADVKTENPTLLKLKGCEEYCPLKKFETILADVLPANIIFPCV